MKGLCPFKLSLINDLRLREPVWTILILNLNKAYMRQVAKLFIPIYAIADYKLIGDSKA